MEPAGNYYFPKEFRLRRRFEFLQVKQMGRKQHTPHFVVFIQQNLTHPTRLGITVSKKVGNAVQRNRVKRLLREFFRLAYSKIPENISISIIAKKGAHVLNLSDLQEELKILERS